MFITPRTSYSTYVRLTSEQRILHAYAVLFQSLIPFGNYYIVHFNCNSIYNIMSAIEAAINGTDAGSGVGIAVHSKSNSSADLLPSPLPVEQPIEQQCTRLKRVRSLDEDIDLIFDQVCKDKSKPGRRGRKPKKAKVSAKMSTGRSQSSQPRASTVRPKSSYVDSICNGDECIDTNDSFDSLPHQSNSVTTATIATQTESLIQPTASTISAPIRTDATTITVDDVTIRNVEACVKTLLAPMSADVGAVQSQLQELMVFVQQLSAKITLLTPHISTSTSGVPNNNTSNNNWDSFPDQTNIPVSVPPVSQPSTSQDYYQDYYQQPQPVLRWRANPVSTPVPTLNTNIGDFMSQSVMPSSDARTSYNSYSSVPAGAAPAQSVAYANVTSRVPTQPLPQRQANPHQDAVAALYVDLHDKERRASNVIVSGVTVVETVADGAIVNDLFRDELKLRLPIKRVQRLGRDASNKCRPLLVTMFSDSDADAIIEKAKDLRKSSNPQVRAKVFINPDMTRAEMQAAYEIRCQRRASRNNGGSRTFFNTAHANMAVAPAVSMAMETADASSPVAAASHC